MTECKKHCWHKEGETPIGPNGEFRARPGFLQIACCHCFALKTVRGSLYDNPIADRQDHGDYDTGKGAMMFAEQIKSLTTQGQ